jgi:CrcB protein
MANALVVFLSGGAGCLSRYLLSLCVFPIMGLPVATLIVNVSGGFFAGVVATKFAHLKPILLIGFLGGFTTFSAFSLECLQMIQNQQIVMAFAYIIASVSLSISAAWLGCYLFS